MWREGVVSGSWTNAANWVDYVLPGANTPATLTRSGADYTIDVESDATLYAPQREKVKLKVNVEGDDKGLRNGRIELIGGEGTLKIGADGIFDIVLPNAGSAVWFIR